TRRIDISYDYGTLLRWLLKMSYNSARAMTEPPPLLESTAGYILKGSSPPAIAFLAVEVVRDTVITDDDLLGLPDELQHWRSVPTRMFRSGPAEIIARGKLLPSHTLRFVALNAWYFFICLVPPDTNRRDKRALWDAFRTQMPDAMIVNPATDRLSLNVSRSSGLDRYRDQGFSVHRQWQDILDGASSKRGLTER